MPITKSAKKALRQSATRQKRNTARKDAYKKAVKDLRKAISEKAVKEAVEKFRAAMKTLDKAAKAGVIKKNKASRLKSRLSQAITKLSKASS